MARILVLLAICVLASGCFVFDEIDQGLESMDKGPKKAAATKPGQPAQGEDGQPKPSWWASARSLNEAPSEPSEAEAGDPKTPVHCRVEGSIRFMRRGDCLSQGGQPQ